MDTFDKDLEYLKKIISDPEVYMALDYGPVGYFTRDRMISFLEAIQKRDLIDFTRGVECRVTAMNRHFQQIQENMSDVS